MISADHCVVKQRSAVWLKGLDRWGGAGIHKGLRTRCRNGRGVGGLLQRRGFYGLPPSALVSLRYLFGLGPERHRLAD